MYSRQKTPFLIFPLIFIAIFIASCEDKYVYEAEKSITNGSWSYSDTLDFKVPVSDTTLLYNLYIEFTHADSFAHQNIYLKLLTRFPDGKRVSRIRSFDLFDIQGKPVGNCSSGNCSTRILLQDNLYFNQAGEYLLTLEQFTRTSPLTGVSKVGILLEKTKKKK